MTGAVSTSGVLLIAVPTGVAIAALTTIGVWLHRRRNGGEP